MMEPDKVTNDILDLLVWEDKNRHVLPDLVELATRARTQPDPNWTEAINYCHEQYAFARSEFDAGAQYWHGVATMYMGAYHYVQNEWPLAINCFSRSEQIFDQEGRPHAQGTAQLALAWAYRVQGARDQAFLWFKRCQRTFEQLREQNRHINQKKETLYQNLIDRLQAWLGEVDNPRQIHLIPAGEVAAGEPIYYVPGPDSGIPGDEVRIGGDQYQPLSLVTRMSRSISLNPNDTFFTFDVRGDSMVDAGIRDGNKILVRKQETVEQREVAVFQIDDEGGYTRTVKAFRQQGDHVYLEPANPRFKARVFQKSSPAVKIMGKVIAVLETIES